MLVFRCLPRRRVRTKLAEHGVDKAVAVCQRKCVSDGFDYIVPAGGNNARIELSDQWRPARSQENHAVTLSDRVPGRGVGAAMVSRSPAGMAGSVRRPRRAT